MAEAAVVPGRADQTISSLDITSSAAGKPELVRAYR